MQREKDIQKMCHHIMNKCTPNYDDEYGYYCCPFCGEGSYKGDADMNDFHHDIGCVYYIAKELRTGGKDEAESAEILFQFMLDERIRYEWIKLSCSIPYGKKDEYVQEGKLDTWKEVLSVVLNVTIEQINIALNHKTII